ADNGRQRAGSHRRGPGENLRAVFHDKDQGDGIGDGHFPAHRRGARRPDRCGNGLPGGRNHSDIAKRLNPRNRPMSLRISIADDEPDMRDYFQKILPALGHAVVCAAKTGKELVEHCLELKPDLVITDIKMPDMDGIEAAVALYRDNPVPVILVSAYHDP